jgi:hypothetical protein
MAVLPAGRKEATMLALRNRILIPMALVAACSVAWSAAQTGAALTQEEEERVRETQDPGERIVVYLDLLQDRLSRFDSFRHKPDDPKYDHAGYLQDLLADYISLNEEMKNWIEYHYEHSGDMRPGLRALLERAPQQLVMLRGIQASSDPYSGHYADSLRDAIDQLTDALDGATRALADQTKKFGEMKRQEKEERRLAKERAKEESKRTKEEKKLRKRQGKKGSVPGETPEE